MVSDVRLAAVPGRSLPVRDRGLWCQGCDRSVVTAHQKFRTCPGPPLRDRKSTRLNSSHSQISYAVFCLKKKNRIHSPADLKGLSEEELGQVAEELRQAIIDNLSRTGGHFASNLAAVEMILALHATY